MATKKQSDYLASLLSGGDDAPAAPLSAAPVEVKSAPQEEETQASVAAPSPAPPAAPNPSPTHRAGLSLLGRDNALARVASGEVRQVTQLQLDPARVRIWAGNARVQEKLSEANCRDLIDSILAEGGQKVPAVVRHISGDPDHDYELIAGTRRHFAIRWLRANSYPDMRLLAQVADLDDEAAFRLADIENRARRDISDIERARNYADAVERHYGGKAARMAERLNLSKGWLSKMLKAAAIPDDVLAAFASWHDLPLGQAYKLASAMDTLPRARAIRLEAAAIVAGNTVRVTDGAEPLGCAAVLSRLLAARPDEGAAPAPDYSAEYIGKSERPILSVKSVTRQGVTLFLPMASGADEQELMEAFMMALHELNQKGVVVR